MHTFAHLLSVMVCTVCIRCCVIIQPHVDITPSRVWERGDRGQIEETRVRISVQRAVDLTEESESRAKDNVYG